MYLYNLGTELSTGRQGWADASGTFHPWPAGGNPPTPAPDASIPGPAAGRSTTIRMPKFSGRVYFSYGQKLVFKLTTGGLVQPAVQNPTDPNRNILFNWSEYTLNDAGLWINSTQVDMFSAPYAVGVQSRRCREDHRSAEAGGYNGFFNALRGAARRLGEPHPDPARRHRTARPRHRGHGMESGALPSTVMDDYINRVWPKYATSTLTVTPFADQPGTKYYGRVSGNVMNFTNGVRRRRHHASRSRTPTASSAATNCWTRRTTWCAARSPAPCAPGYNRSTLLINPNQPDTSSARASTRTR